MKKWHEIELEKVNKADYYVPVPTVDVALLLVVNKIGRVYKESSGPEAGDQLGSLLFDNMPHLCQLVEATTQSFDR